MTSDRRSGSVTRVFTVTAPASTADWVAYYDLRWTVLRAPWQQPRGSERDEFESDAWHLLARDEASPDRPVVAVGRLHRLNPTEAQVRYMAVAASHRGRGLGRLILQGLEACARERGLQRIVLNARASALGFYAGQGYSDLGPGPTPFGIPHRVMAKRLD